MNASRGRATGFFFIIKHKPVRAVTYLSKFELKATQIHFYLLISNKNASLQNENGSLGSPVDHA